MTKTKNYTCNQFFSIIVCIEKISIFILAIKQPILCMHEIMKVIAQDKKLRWRESIKVTCRNKVEIILFCFCFWNGMILNYNIVFFFLCEKKKKQMLKISELKDRNRNFWPEEMGKKWSLFLLGMCSCTYTVRRTSG